MASAQAYALLLGNQKSGFATIREILDARADREDRRLARDIQRQNLQLQQRRLDDAASSDAEEKQAQLVVRDAFTQFTGPDGPDEEAITNHVIQHAGPVYAKRVSDFFDDHRTKQNAATNAALTQYKSKMDQVSGYLGSVTDDEGYQAVRPAIARIDPEAFKTLPEHYDDNPKVVEIFANAALNESEKTAKRLAARTATTDARGRTLNELATSTNQREWSGAWDGAKKDFTAAELRRMGFSDEFSPEQAQRAGQLLQTADQRASDARQDASAATSATNAARMDLAQQETARHNRVMEQRPTGQGGTAQETGDAKDIAAAIISGDQPPVLTGLYRFAAPVRAELARQGYDLATALSDWNATQKRIATLNGAQQTRLVEAVKFTHDSLDVVEDLAKQWDAGKFPILNRASLIAAKNGAMGQQAASIATQLDSQIADLVSELGTVYKGGNSSTDHSLELAANNLKSDWSRKVLLDNIALVRKNLTIRNNSMKLSNVGVAGASPNNPYAPTPTVAPPTGRYNPATGKVE